MPQSSDELRARWWPPGDDTKPWRQLGENFTSRIGILRPRPGYQPTVDDLSAIDFLCSEWDYGYEGP